MSYIYIKKNREKSVLCAQPDEEQFFKQSTEEQGAQYTGIGPHCLLFDSFFECGNLERAEYVSPTDYNLYLNVDANTKGHQQWFYFRVKNTFKNKKYTFTIRNFTKPFSLHRQGMRVLMKSKKRKAEEPKGSNSDSDWNPLPEEAIYLKTDIQRSGWRVPGPLNLDDEEDDDQILDDINGIDGVAALNGNGPSTGKRPIKSLPLGGAHISSQHQGKKRRRYFYSLTFKVFFDYDDDEVYFAYSTPYLYS